MLWADQTNLLQVKRGKSILTCLSYCKLFCNPGDFLVRRKITLETRKTWQLTSLSLACRVRLLFCSKLAQFEGFVSSRNRIESNSMEFWGPWCSTRLLQRALIAFSLGTNHHPSFASSFCLVNQRILSLQAKDEVWCIFLHSTGLVVSSVYA